MPYYRRILVIAFSRALALLLTTHVQAAMWIRDSLELQVADADIVVRGTLETVGQIPGSLEQKSTFHIIETLKGKAGPSIECLIPYGHKDDAEAWQKGKTELLVCLVKSERYRAPGSREPMAAEWSVRHGGFGSTGIIPLNEDRPGHVPTTDFRLVSKADEIVKLAREAAHADAVTKIPREPSGVVSIVLDVPFGSPLDESLHSKSANGLTTVLNEALEAKAGRWIKADDEIQKLNGVSVLSHFKSDENIAALKTLLTDQSVQGRLEGPDIIRTYRVRAAALAVLKAWGVESTAVISERTSTKDH